MAIEKMVLIKIIGSLNDMHKILKQLILSESVHLDFEENNTYDDNYMLHEYEALVPDSYDYKKVDYDNIRQKCSEIEQSIEKLCQDAGIELKVDKKYIDNCEYSIDEAYDNLEKIHNELGYRLDEINSKKTKINELLEFEKKMNSIDDKSLDFNRLSNLNYFDYEVGTLSQEDKVRMKRNYENISAVALKIGIIRSSIEDMYIVIYPKQFKDENTKLLKSLNWNRLNVPVGVTGTVEQMLSQVEDQVISLSKEVATFYKEIEENKKNNELLLNKIYSAIKLEKRIYELEKDVTYGENVFVINAWTREADRDAIENSLRKVTDKFAITHKSPEQIDKPVMPPTKLKNNTFSKPFETIVRLYGLPSYYEIDPTPFLSITFFLMFGLMFGDIGQGLVYFLAGLFIIKKSQVAGQILERLGISSMIFGFVYGSFFGLEKAELPWLPSLIGRPLDPKNIMPILIMGVVFGVVVLTVSYGIGILNRLKKKNIEEGIFGKNGLMGYIFFISLVLIGVCLTKVISLPIWVPATTLILSLVIMILKQPITHLFIGKRPLIHGSAGSYFTESIFEGIETILSALSNAISFIRVGAFALNHAGLFLAFLVMSEMTSNLILKIFILILGNVLILTLEGLVVFIQGLRLEYYEMFSKYFNGDGVEFNPIKIVN